MSSGSDKDPFPMCRVLLSVEEENESEHQDSDQPDSHSAQYKREKQKLCADIVII